jgi:glucosylceramidase
MNSNMKPMMMSAGSFFLSGSLRSKQFTYPAAALFLFMILFANSCMQPKPLDVEIFETSESGHQLTRVSEFTAAENPLEINILPDETFQTITGFGGSFSEATAYLLQQLSQENKAKILEAYFGETGARYSLTRTHINSCDFSLSNYSYAPVAGDMKLDSFSIQEDMDDIVPIIKEAMAISKDGFKIISSPWTAPPWMKDNNDWRGGKLLPEYYDTWALFFSKYLNAYKAQGIDIWGITVENEPLGNDGNWDSMHFTPEEMNQFVKNHLGPKLKADGHKVKILGFDQNRDEQLKKWVDVMFADQASSEYFDGTAVHWYASTYDYFADALQYAHRKAPDKHLINTESCVDAQIPVWKNDAWYWSKEATDWGWDWAPEDQKYLHPKYEPVFRYARDIIGCLNNRVDGWVDWNMVLDKQGGPNWAKNWCVAPVIVDPEQDEVYFTPLYYTLAHFSRFIRPGAVRIGFNHADKDLMVTAARNPDGSIAVVVFNPETESKSLRLRLAGQTLDFSIAAKAVQTLVVHGR